VLPVDRLRRHHEATEEEIEQLRALHDELDPESQATVGNLNDDWLDRALAKVRKQAPARAR
jgi:hypothetical protein